MEAKQYAPGECYDYPLIIKKILTTALRTAPGQAIVYRDQRRFTYAEMGARVHRLANGLADLGVAPGDTVAVMDWDSHRYLESYFAIPMMGAVLQTVNWRLAPEQVLYTIQHAEAKVLMLHRDFWPLWEAIRPHAETIRTVILLGETPSEGSVAPTVDAVYETLLAEAEPAYAFPEMDENTKATTFYTTGTTGNPKGVHFSHRQLVLHTLAVAVTAGSYENLHGFRSRDVYMPLTPMFHVHAWGYPYVATMIGTKQVYPGRYEPGMLLNLIAAEKVTYSHCVPTVLQMILAHPEAAAADLSQWSVTIGGAPLSKGLAKAARAAGVGDIHSGYGMSETCPVISVARPKDHMMDWEEDPFLDVLTMTGLPIPLVELEVMDAGGNILPHDGRSTGEVVMRAPWLTRSYFKAPDKTKELWRNGWLHSGDVGYIDEAGYLKITDRIKDVIKSGGEWISSLDLENIMSQHPAVAETAAVGVPDAKWGERPLVLVTLKPEYREKLDVDDLKKHMREASKAGVLPKYAVPDHYLVVDEIPKTSVGKIDKKRIRQDYPVEKV